MEQPSKIVVHRFQHSNLVSLFRCIQVIRGGRRIQVSIFDIVVGDVVALKIGDQVSKQTYFALIYDYSVCISDLIFGPK